METGRVVFHRFDKRDDRLIRECALLMAQNEPWITLKRQYSDVMEIIEEETSEVHLAQSGDEIIGFAIVKMRGAFVGYVQSIVISPQHRNRGIGKAFMKYLEELIFAEHPNVFICVSSFNPGAKRLYDSMGYDVVGELKDYIVHGHSEILMRKSRSPLSEFKARAG
jgi:ribosomal protein S18 acetylase RimI-like enzyme